jgi:hypothetical protein
MNLTCVHCEVYSAEYFFLANAGVEVLDI